MYMQCQRNPYLVLFVGAERKSAPPRGFAHPSSPRPNRMSRKPRSCSVRRISQSACSFARRKCASRVVAGERVDGGRDLTLAAVQFLLQRSAVMAATILLRQSLFQCALGGPPDVRAVGDDFPNVGQNRVLKRRGRDERLERVVAARTAPRLADLVAANPAALAANRSFAWRRQRASWTSLDVSRSNWPPARRRCA
jgi:hypothetical protein